ncbi:MAG TPA: hypothetical protein VLN59_16315, partial [Burkholderiales bacterium]|nr:hypothetical protein [Burkholderiales bacterium]
MLLDLSPQCRISVKSTILIAHSCRAVARLLLSKATGVTDNICRTRNDHAQARRHTVVLHRYDGRRAVETA